MCQQVRLGFCETVERLPFTTSLELAFAELVVACAGLSRVCPTVADGPAEGLFHEVYALLSITLGGVEVGEDLDQVGLVQMTLLQPVLAHTQRTLNRAFKLLAPLLFHSPIEVSLGSPERVCRGRFAEHRRVKLQVL